MIVLHHKATGKIVRQPVDQTILVFQDDDTVEDWCREHGVAPHMYHESIVTLVERA